MIRDATHDDIPALLAMGERFARVAGLDQIAEYDPESMAKTFRFLIDNPDGILVIGDGGAAGGLVHAAYWNVTHRTGQEMFWWVDPERRGALGRALFEALEAAARDRGAGSWTMIALDASQPERVAAIYERRGYRPLERSFVRTF